MQKQLFRFYIKNYYQRNRVVGLERKYFLKRSGLMCFGLLRRPSSRWLVGWALPPIPCQPATYTISINISPSIQYPCYTSFRFLAEKRMSSNYISWKRSEINKSDFLHSKFQSVIFPLRMSVRVCACLGLGLRLL